MNLRAFVVFACSLFYSVDQVSAEGISHRWIGDETGSLTVTKVGPLPLEIPVERLPEGWSIKTPWVDRGDDDHRVNVSGMTMDANGEPMADAVVLLQTATIEMTRAFRWRHAMALAISDSDGRFDFGNVGLAAADIAPGHGLQVTAMKRGHAVGFQVIETARAKPAVVFEVPMMKQTPWTTIIRDPNGNPMANVDVEVSRYTFEGMSYPIDMLGSVAVNARTDAKGRLTLSGIPESLPTGDLVPIQYMPDEKALPPQLAAWVTDENGDRFGAVLQPGMTDVIGQPVKLVGRVRGLGGDANQYVLYVMGVSRDRRLPWHVYVPLDDSFSVDTAIPFSGRARVLRIALMKRGKLGDRIETTVARQDDQSKAWRFQIDVPPLRTLRGRVVGPGGNGIRGVEVHSLDQEPKKIQLSENSSTMSPPRSVITDSTGRFELLVSTDQTSIGLTAMDESVGVKLPVVAYLSNSAEIPDSCRLSLEAGQEDLGLLHVTVQRTGTFQVVARDPHGQPVKDAVVVATLVGPRSSKLTPATTDANGVAEYPVLADGSVMHLRLSTSAGDTAQLVIDGQGPRVREVILRPNNAPETPRPRKELLREIWMAWQPLQPGAPNAGGFYARRIEGRLELPPGLDVSNAIVWPLASSVSRFFFNGGGLGSTVVVRSSVRPGEDGSVRWPTQEFLIPEWMDAKPKAGDVGAALISHPDAILPPVRMVADNDGVVRLQEMGIEAPQLVSIQVVDQDKQPVVGAIPVLFDMMEHGSPLVGAMKHWNGPRTDADGVVRTRVYGRPRLVAWADDYVCDGVAILKPNERELRIEMTKADAMKPKGDYPVGRLGRNYIDPRVCLDQQNPRRHYKGTRLVRLTVNTTDGAEALGLIRIDLGKVHGNGMSSQASNVHWRVDRQPSLTIEVPVGAALQLNGDGLIGCWIQPRELDGPFDLVPEGDELLEREVELAPAGLIRGRFVDAGGWPVEKYRISVRQVSVPVPKTSQPSYAQYRSVGSRRKVDDRDGAFSLGPFPCDGKTIYQVIVDTADGRSGISTPILLTRDQPVSDVTITEKDAIRLTGRLVDEDGRPLVDAAIGVATGFSISDENFARLPRTNRDGDFEITVPQVGTQSTFSIYLVKKDANSSSMSSILTLDRDRLKWSKDLGAIKVKPLQSR